MKRKRSHHLAMLLASLLTLCLSAPAISSETVTGRGPLTGSDVPRGILLEQFVVSSQDLLPYTDDWDGGALRVKWEAKILGPLGLQPGSPQAEAFESLLRDLKVVVSKLLNLSVVADELPEHRYSELRAVDQDRLRQAARRLATYAEEHGGRSGLNDLFRLMEGIVQPAVSIFASESMWVYGDPWADFKDTWAPFDQELDRLLPESDA